MKVQKLAKLGLFDSPRVTFHYKWRLFQFHVMPLWYGYNVPPYYSRCENDLSARMVSLRVKRISPGMNDSEISSFKKIYRYYASELRLGKLHNCIIFYAVSFTTLIFQLFAHLYSTSENLKDDRLNSQIKRKDYF